MSEDSENSHQVDRIEASLRSALKRQCAPAGFVEQLEARIKAKHTRSRQPVWFVLKPGRVSSLGYGERTQLAAAAALLLVIVLPLGLQLHHRSELARGEAAKQQVLLALRITGTQLRSIQSRTQPINAEESFPAGEPQ